MSEPLLNDNNDIHGRHHTTINRNIDTHPEDFNEVEIRDSDVNVVKNVTHSDSDQSKQLGYNPQEASVLDYSQPHTDFDVPVYNDNLAQPSPDNDLHHDENEKYSVHSKIIGDDDNKISNNNSMSSREIRKWKALRHRRGKEPRKVSIVDSSLKSKGKCLSLPAGHCNTVLIRRAVRKRCDINQNKDSTSNLDEYGDVSLGMKLSVVDGKVIVQNLNRLDDGRASPAQLTGVIERGDIIVSINQRSLVNLPIDHLMSRLSPLSAADATGYYPKRIKLRIAKGVGLDLIESMEMPDPSNNVDMLGLFPMVDQLSGMPYFEKEDTTFNELPAETASITHETQAKAKEKPMEVENEPNSQQLPQITSRQTMRNQLISQNLALIRTQDRDRILHEYETWNRNFMDSFESDNQVDESTQCNPDTAVPLSKLVESGLNAMLGAAVISKQAEYIDAGLERRTWSSTMSLYSWSSVRRKRRIANGSVSLSFSRVEERSDEDKSADGFNSLPSTISEDGEQINADEALLRLAAHDEIWRQQMIDNLVKLSCEEKELIDNNNEEEKMQQSEDIDSAVTSFLFGTQMTKILKKQGKPRSLPSEEITAILFDITTKVASSVPYEIIATNESMILPSNGNLFDGLKQPQPLSDTQLATIFLLEQALPAWLKSFRPLPWEHRRYIWPLQFRVFHGGSTAGSSMSDDLTIETMGTNRPTVTPRTDDDLVSVIEDREMNTETRGETCFLVTYYFTQALLPRFKVGDESNEVENQAMDKMIVFLGEYGSYLMLHTCLVYAAMVEAEPVIDILLSIAKSDPRHREVMKQTSKLNQIVFYEPSMLSALVQRLYNINGEKYANRKKMIVELCSSAYPDVRPWQVKKYCIELPQQNSAADASGMEILYYKYLSLLLDPNDGNEAARHDPRLVAEWCEMSVIKAMETESINQVFADNFLNVATLTNQNQGIYHRDRVLLLNQSIELKDDSLALNLVYEILEDPKLASIPEVVSIVLMHIREIAFKTIVNLTSYQDISNSLLNRVIALYTFQSIRDATNVSVELLNLLERYKERNKRKPISLYLLQYFANECIPKDILTALATFATDEVCPEVLIHIQTILKRSATMSSQKDELSTTRLRLRVARKYISEKSSAVANEKPLIVTDVSDDRHLWRKMANGMLNIEK